ncbi:MAG: hypothetical protein WBB28_01580 [Crinalium sp.]
MARGLIDDIGFQPIEAASEALDGFTVRWDYLGVIKNYMRETMILWPMLPKEQAESDPVQELAEGPEPLSGFVDKIGLAPPENPEDLLAHHPGIPQPVKAVGGVVRFGHYARSLYAQQGKPFGELVARRTTRMLIKTLKTLEKALFTGNSSINPLEFNGIDRQMNPANIYPADLTTGDSIVRKLRGIVRLAMDDPDILKNITHIYCSGLALNILENEVDAKLEYHNLDMIRPGLRVPAIVTQAGIIPILPSPFVPNIKGRNGAKDIIRFYLLDTSSLVWKGVYPEGGQRTFEPQIFEVSTFNNSAVPYLLDKRMALAYGTLYLGNAGMNVYRLDCAVPNGTIGSI